MALAAAVFVLAAVRSTAEDTVFLSAEGSSRSAGRITGTIVNYTGEEIVVRLASGRETSLDASRVESIVTEYTAEHVAGDDLFRQKQFAQAIDRYRGAIRAESRTWVRRQILAQLVWCDRARGNMDSAAEAFLLVVQSDPTTQYFDAIPLVWLPLEPSASAESKAVRWLADDAMPAAQLIGASWLLSAARRPAAIRTLQQLTNQQDARVALLAAAQLWRTRSVMADLDEIAAWKRMARRLPDSLRGGPYFIIGTALARHKQHEQAALALLRAPLMHPQQRTLAAAGLLAAGEQLEKMNQRRQAAQLYRELLADFPNMTLAADAEEHLRRLAGEE